MDYEKFSDETGYNVKPRKNTPYQEDLSRTYGRVLDAKSYATHTGVPLIEAALHMQVGMAGSSISEFLEAYEAFKAREGKYDFDDMLKEVLAKGPIGTPIILVDECQDLSNLQLDIVKEWSVGCEALYLAGDDDQSIYAFNGASEYGFLDFPADETEVLRKSYRVPLAIGNRANRIIRKVVKRQSKNVEWRPEEGTIDRINDYKTLYWEEAYEKDRDIMVLARHRKMVVEVRDYLWSLNIPCTIDGKSVWSQETVKQVQNFYKLKAGGFLTAPELADLLGAMGRKNERRDLRKKISVQKEFYLDDIEPVDHWWREMKGKHLDVLNDIITERGIEILDKAFTIDVSTMHASKGREADAVVILTDCYQKVIDNLFHNPDTEIRLCYVALTRAREKAIIVNPDTERYLKPLLEA